MAASLPEEIGFFFTDAIIEIIFKMTGFSFNIISTDRDDEFYNMTGLMALNSKRRGLIFISASEADMRILCSYLIGVPQDNIEKDDIEDALCELVNMTAGNAKLRFGGFNSQVSMADYMFTLSTPLVIRGEGMSVTTREKLNVISITLGNGEIFVKLKVVY